MNIRKDDKVIVLSGKDKGKEGKVLKADPKAGKLVVEGVNVATKHAKPRKQGDVGGIMDVEGAMYADKVQLFCSKCGKGVRTGIKTDGDKKVRVCKKCGKEF